MVRDVCVCVCVSRPENSLGGGMSIRKARAIAEKGLRAKKFRRTYYYV